MMGRARLWKNEVGQFREYKSWMEKALSQADSLVNKVYMLINISTIVGPPRCWRGWIVEWWLTTLLLPQCTCFPVSLGSLLTADTAVVLEHQQNWNRTGLWSNYSTINFGCFSLEKHGALVNAPSSYKLQWQSSSQVMKMNPLVHKWQMTTEVHQIHLKNCCALTPPATLSWTLTTTYQSLSANYITRRKRTENWAHAVLWKGQQQDLELVLPYKWNEDFVKKK